MVPTTHPIDYHHQLIRANKDGKVTKRLQSTFNKFDLDID